MLLHRFSCSLIALSLPLFAACGYGDHMSSRHHDGVYTNDTSTPSTTIEQSTIDTDQTLESDPGAGAGVFVEYASGGAYRVTTTCDFAQGNECYWDIVATPLDNASVQGVAPIALENDDSVTLGAGNQVRLVAYTGKDSDGFSLQTDPGAAIEIDALLDNGPANRYLFWVGDGALHSGAPSNPIDLIPSSN